MPDPSGGGGTFPSEPTIIYALLIKYSNSYPLQKGSDVYFAAIYYLCLYQKDGIYNKGFLNIDDPYFEGMAKQIYPPELQLNKANNTDTEAPCLDLHLSIANGDFFFFYKIYDKRDDFDFEFNVGLKPFYARAFRNQNFMVTWFTNLRN